MKSVILFLLAALFLSGCTSPFWDDDPDTEAFNRPGLFLWYDPGRVLLCGSPDRSASPHL